MRKITWRIINILLYVYAAYQHIRRAFFSVLRPKHAVKIFCIGYPKTGTTSLYKALKMLGYRTSRIPFGRVYRRKGPQYIQLLTRCNYDAFVDYPLYKEGLYQLIDSTFPNSKFILTIRDSDSFAKSFVNFYKESTWDLEIINEEQLRHLRQTYEAHNEEVQTYFKAKPSQLLFINIIEGDGWEKLCPFLDKPIPSKPFPHKNKGKYRD